MSENIGAGEGERDQRLQLLRTLSDLLQKTDGLSAVIDCVQEQFPRLLGVDRASVLIYDAQRGVLVSNHVEGAICRPDELAEPQKFHFSICGRCFTEGAPIVISDCSRSDAIPQEYAELLQLKSMVAVPILLESLPMGVLRLDDNQQNGRFSDGDVEFYQLVAERISTAIRHLQVSADRTLAEEALRLAYEDMERRVEDRTAELARANQALNRELLDRKRAERVTEVFARLGQRLSVADTPRVAAEATLKAAEELFGWDACFATLTLEDGRLDTVIQQDRIDGQICDVPQVCVLPGPITRKTLDEGPQLILRYHRQCAESPPPHAQCFGSPRLSASLMFVPVSRGTEMIGVLSVQSYAPNAYGPKDLELFVSLAMFCCGAFERTRSAERLRRSEEALRQEKAFVQLLGDVSAAANQADSVDSAIQVTLDRICQVTGWPIGHCLVGLPDGRTQVSTGIWHLRDPERFRRLKEVSEGVRFEMGVGLPGVVMQTKAPVVIPSKTPQPWMLRWAETEPFGIEAAFAFPVFVSQEVVAVLEFFSDSPYAPSPRMMEIMGHVGLQLGRVIERKRAQERLTHGALHDPLTGLPNRVFFADALERAAARARRHVNYRYAVLYLDLDRFKMVNDSHGPAIGDKFLQSVAERLNSCIREGDFVARLGGDEFGVLLDDIPGPSDAVAAAERIQAALSAPIDCGSVLAYTSASIGISLSRLGGDAEPLDLLRDADVAVYRAKAAGRSTYAVFDEAMHAQVVQHLQIETELRKALERGEFVIHYQPIVSMVAGRVTGFEALVRWNHPERGLLNPSDFLPQAEETGLIVPIGWEVLRQACHWMRSRLDASPAETDLSVSVNITARQLREPDLLIRIRSILSEAALPPRNLHLEVTEGSVMEEVEATVAVLTNLHDMGVQVLVDDFGTGYSSLSYLAKFPIDALKIDQSFVQGLASATGHAEVVQAILALACGLRLGVVAEGVETWAQLAELRGLGCELTQGYLFSRPLDAETALHLSLDVPELAVP